MPMNAAENTLSTPTTAAERKALVGTLLFEVDHNQRDPERQGIGCHYLVLKCGPKLTKVANVTFGPAEGAHKLWHHDTPTDSLADYFRLATASDYVYTPEAE